MKQSDLDVLITCQLLELCDPSGCLFSTPNTYKYTIHTQKKKNKLSYIYIYQVECVYVTCVSYIYMCVCKGEYVCATQHSPCLVCVINKPY